MLSLEEITLEVGEGEETRALLDAVSLQMRRGQFVGLIGPSGCGKSTLLKIIAGLSDPTEGTVRWDGRDLATEGDLPPAELGYVPQFSLAHDLLTVRECVDYAARLRVDGPDAEQRAERVDALLATVGLETLADRQARVLSGGQRRRLSLAVETVTSPSLLLCDEVTSGLDPGSAHEIMKLMHSLARADGGGRRVVVNVTHSLADMELYDRIIVLFGGRLVFDAAPAHLAHYFRVETPDAVYARLGSAQARAMEKLLGETRAVLLRVGSGATAVRRPRRRRAFRVKPSFPRCSQAHARRPPTSSRKSRTTGPGATKATAFSKRSRDDDDDMADPDEDESAPRVATPGGLTQFAVVFERRLRLFARDRAQAALQLALIAGFPCLVVIFALRGLPSIRNLSMDNGQNIVEQLRETTEYLTAGVRRGRAGQRVAAVPDHPAGVDGIEQFRAGNRGRAGCFWKARSWPDCRAAATWRRRRRFSRCW